MNMKTSPRLDTKLTIQADRKLVEELRRAQVAHEQKTGVRASMSALAVGLLRQGLQQQASA